ncbi:MAG: hypothetical protein OXG10_00765 [Candidatus Dadabacteria bacterium]|nr:hypothetical protein [Candidatus Dadabacteria bacterium]
MKELKEMNIETESESSIDDLPPTTVPEGIQIRLGGLKGETEEELKEYGNKLSACLRTIGTVIDMSGLDGITAVVDYEGALAEFSRDVKGPEGKNQLKPTNDGIARGVAMTVAFPKDGEVKSHMFFNYYFLKGIDYDLNSEVFQFSLSIIAHECAHVEATSKFDSVFPGVSLKRYPDACNALDRAKWGCAIYPCWEEYIACRRSSCFGKNPLDDQVDTLLQTLDGIDEKADCIIEEWERDDDKDYGKVFYGLFKLYGDLIKYSSYVLGTMHGSGLTVEDVSSLRDGLADSWFTSYFDNLGELCEALYESYGIWEDYGAFNPIGDLLEKIVARKGVSARPCGDDLYVTLIDPL